MKNIAQFIAAHAENVKEAEQIAEQAGGIFISSPIGGYYQFVNCDSTLIIDQRSEEAKFYTGD